MWKGHQELFRMRQCPRRPISYMQQIGELQQMCQNHFFIEKTVFGGHRIAFKIHFVLQHCTSYSDSDLASNHPCKLASSRELYNVKVLSTQERKSHVNICNKFVAYVKFWHSSYKKRVFQYEFTECKTMDSFFTQWPHFKGLK